MTLQSTRSALGAGQRSASPGGQASAVFVFAAAIGLARA
jgi:hypothetical protein